MYMGRPNELEHNLQVLVSSKVLNLDVTLGSIVNAGALADIDPWDVICGNGWIVRRRGPLGPRIDVDVIRNVVRDELQNAGLLKG